MSHQRRRRNDFFGLLGSLLDRFLVFVDPPVVDAAADPAGAEGLEVCLGA